MKNVNTISIFSKDVMESNKNWIINQRIAHRGLYNDQAPENTLAAFENAINANYPIELDVRAIDDGSAVVFHDDKLSRMTNRDGYVSKLTLEDLDSIYVGKSMQKISTLKQVLEFVNGRTPLLIKIINDGGVGALERNVGELLNRYNGEFAVESFNPYVLGFFKNKFPHFFRGQISGDFKGVKTLGFIKRSNLSRMVYNKHISCPNFISYDFHALPNPYVAKYRKTIPVISWVIKSEDEYQRIKNMCDNIIFEKYVPTEKQN